MSSPLLTPPLDPLSKLVRWEFNRKLTLWMHGGLAVISGFVYLSTLHINHFAYWRAGRWAGVGGLVLCFPALLPYLLSAAASHRLIGHDRICTWLFAGIVTCGAVLTWCLFLGVIGSNDRLPSVPVIVIVQTLGYWLAAGTLFAGFKDETYHREAKAKAIRTSRPQEPR